MTGPGAAEFQERIAGMFRELERAPREMLPSKYWEELNRKNLEQLASEGYDSFKRTLARSYFTWIVRPGDAQIRWLRDRLPCRTVAGAALRTLFSGSHPPLTWAQSRSYTFLTRLLWEYVARRDPDGLLERLTEPVEGNPPRLYRGGRLISQDLANAALEFRSILAPEVDRAQLRTAMELGAGYGRTAFALLSLLPELRYVVVDIPPALAVSERYLSGVFPDRRIFRFRPFTDFARVRSEFESSRIAFLLPQQMDLLPDGSVDLFLNISSFHEMRIEQIRCYFGILRRLVRKYAYLKQWRESVIPVENVTIRESDYPIPADWRRIYWRPCAVQEHFFEALFEVAR